MNNKKSGTAYEKEFCQLLAEQGFWSHRLQDNSNGQPFDIIAAKDGKVYAIDCKDCQGMTFPLSRIEENQRYAMDLWRQCGNGDGYFAVQFGNGEEWLLYYSALMYLEENGTKQLSVYNADAAGFRIDPERGIAL